MSRYTERNVLSCRAQFHKLKEELCKDGYLLTFECETIDKDLYAKFKHRSNGNSFTLYQKNNTLVEYKNGLLKKRWTF